MGQASISRETRHPRALQCQVPGLRLLCEFVAFGHSALSGCSFIGSWFDSAGLVFSGGLELEVAEYFSGFNVDDHDVQVVDEHSDSCSGMF